MHGDKEVKGAAGWVASVIAAAENDSGHRMQTRRAVRALKVIGTQLLSPGHTAAEVQALADALEELGTRLEPGPAEDPAPGPRDYVDTNPNLGLSNYLAPPLRFEVPDEPGVLRARVRYGRAHEGPPGCAHGGHIAAFFDELLASCQTLVAGAVVTGQLSVRYRRAVPLYTDLEGEARVAGQQGRKRLVRGHLTGTDGVVLAEAEALMFPMRSQP